MSSRLTHSYLLAVAEYFRDELSPRYRGLAGVMKMAEANELLAKLDELDKVVDVVIAGLEKSKAQSNINAQAVTDATVRVGAVIEKLGTVGK
jgi:hypothetical protein